MARKKKKKTKPMNADNPSKITKIGKNKTLISPPDNEVFGSFGF